MHAAVLRYFDHVARHGSIRKAADALSVASSAVNRQILRLEDEMGVALFERGRSGVRPTAAGELLLRHVRETQNEYQRTRAEIASLGGTVSGDVRIISLESLLVRFLPQVVDEMSAKHPKVSFTVLAAALPLIAFVYENWGFDALFRVLAVSAAVILGAVLMLPQRLPRAQLVPA